LSAQIIKSSAELEYYDYTSSNGLLETINMASQDPAAVQAMVNELLNNLLPNELQQKLPGQLGVQQQLSKTAHLAFREFIDLQPAGVWQKGGLRRLLGIGGDF